MKYAVIRLNNVVVYDGKLRIEIEVPSDAKVFNNMNYYYLTDDEIKILRKMLKFQVTQKECLKYTSRQISESYGKEELVKEYIKAYDDITRMKNIVGKRVRDFTEIYWPEITDKSIGAIFNYLTELDFNQKPDTELGGNFESDDLKGFKLMLDQWTHLDVFEVGLRQNIELIMREIAPNFTFLAHPLIAARLLNAAGSLRHLALLPASTIQMLGAEKAMFRFLRTNSRPPKYGFLFSHPLISKAKNKGRIARKLANKLSLMIKRDVFGNGEFVAEEVYSELEKEL